MAKNALQIIIETQGAKKASSDIDGVSKSTSGLATVAKGTAIAASLLIIAEQAAQFGLAAFNASAQVERLGVATETMARRIGSSEAGMLAAIQDASGGTVTQLDALTAANKAMLFGLVENSGQMSELTTIARTLGNAMGQDTATSLNDLTTALGRQSPMILDNLGLIADVEGWQTKYAAALGKTAEQLTEAERKQAFVNGALEAGRVKVEELGGVIPTAADSTDRLAASWDDLRVTIGKGVEGPMVGATNWLADVVDKVDAALGKNDSLANEYDYLNDKLKEFNKITAEGGQLTQQAKMQKAEIERLLRINKIKQENVIRERAQTVAMSQSLTILEQEEVQINRNTDATIERGKAETDRLNAMADFYGHRADAQAIIDDYNGIGEDAAAAFNEGVQSQIDSLQSEISGATSSVLSAGTGVLSDLGLGLDANVGRDVAEDARRVAAIMVGDFNGEAATLLSQSNPELFKKIMESEDPQATARKMLENFQLGIGAADIIDKEAAKDRVKQMIYGTRDLKALNDEITAELMASGEFTAQEVSGALNAASPVAAGVSSGLPKALKEQGTGKILINTISAQVKANEDEMANLAKIFATGFDEYLPGALSDTGGIFLEAISISVAERLGLAVE